MSATRLVWFRSDLRLADHPALLAAAAQGRVVPVYLHTPAPAGELARGAASRLWLHHSLDALAQSLAAAGSPLVVAAGSAAQAVLLRLARATGATGVYWNRCPEATDASRDAAVAADLQAHGLEVQVFATPSLGGADLRTAAGQPFRVFTPFWRALQARGAPPEPLPAPALLAAPERRADGLPLEALELTPKHAWGARVMAAWRPGSASAKARLDAFLQGAIDAYPEARDAPGGEGISRLSPHLHFGEISPREVWHGVLAREHAAGRALPSDAALGYLRQLAWREFARHLLQHFPHTVSAPLRPEFADFPWRRDALMLRAWERGRTGYPVVDAGMRELWQTGWMHNRVRMIVASFLVKDLLLPWQDGARWFWDTLVDADLANNTLGWQWTAGCGADAAPYFRVFNPVTQGERHDPRGVYVRRWLPELARLPDNSVHQPWRAGADVLETAGVRLGVSYPRPIVDHAAARERALAAYASLRVAPA